MGFLLEVPTHFRVKCIHSSLKGIYFIAKVIALKSSTLHFSPLPQVRHHRIGKILTVGQCQRKLLLMIVQNMSKNPGKFIKPCIKVRQETPLSGPMSVVYLAHILVKHSIVIPHR